MVNKINEALCRYSMGEIFEGAIVGFSGGADSSCLLHYLKDKTKKLLAVHINHMIRGEEAQRDEDMCRRTCEKYGVAFRCVRVDIPTLSRERKAGLEETAREERYRVFREILRDNPEYRCVVTAHNANDNAETVLFNMARGSGLNGLCGISPVNNGVYRPLILCTREEIIEYCRVNNIEYVEDSTNNDVDYTRNRIRHLVMPQMMLINPSFANACSRLSDILRQDEEYIGKEADKILSECKNGRLPREIATGLDGAVLARVLKKLASANIDYTAVSSIIGLINSWQAGKMLNLSKGITFKLEHSYCGFINTKDTQDCEFCVPLHEGENVINEKTVCLNCQISDPLYKELGSVRLNSREIYGKLYARSKRDGDTVKSLGVTKKLKRVFSDLHIPSHTRQGIPVICDDKGIVCIPGIIARDGAFDKKGDITVKLYEK